MADEESEKVVLEGEKALALLREGKDAWNKWAEDNPGARVSFEGVEFGDEEANFEGFVFLGEADFSGATFSGNATFYNATFSGDAKFSDAKFSEKATFREATFSGYALFDQATFSRNAYFHNAEFSGDAWFRLVEFNKMAFFRDAVFKGKANFSDGDFYSSVNFSNVMFVSVPDFCGTRISAHFTFHGVNINTQKHTDSEDTDRLCRLKELASIAKDHVREQDFFALELKAKRSHKSSSLLRYVADVIFITLYQVLSNFGRSVTVPVFWLLGIWLSCGIYFACLPCSDPVAGICKGLTTSASLIFPFLGASRASLKAGFAGSDAAVAFAEGGLGILFLFLIGLALRNRFRI